MLQLIIGNCAAIIEDIKHTKEELKSREKDWMLVWQIADQFPVFDEFEASNLSKPLAL